MGIFACFDNDVLQLVDARSAELAIVFALFKPGRMRVGYFDAVAMVISGGRSSTTALAGSTETAQFHEDRQINLPQHGHDEGLVHNHDWAVHDWAAQ